MKIQIWYMFDAYAEKFNREDQECEAYLSWKLPNGESESLVGRGATFPEAKAKAIALYLQLPPSEEFEL